MLFFFAGGILECNLAHSRSAAVLCMLFKMKSNPMHPQSGALILPYLSARVLVLWLLIGTRLRLLAVEPLSTMEPLCPSQYQSGTILVILYLMVWDWRVLRAEPMLSCWPNLLFLFCLLLVSLFLPAVGWLCGVVVTDCSVRTLSQPCAADSVLIIIIFRCYSQTPPDR